MSDRLTSCGPRDCAAAWRGHGVGWSEYGLQTRAAMIEQFRRHYRAQMAKAEYALSLTDDELIVETYVGPWAMKNKREVVD